MKSCPNCHEKYGNQVAFCPVDGAKLEAVEMRGDPYMGATLAGRYKVLERLGAGGFGTVYKVMDTRLEHVRALKVFNRQRLPPEEIEKAVGRFEREAKLMGRLGDRSRHIVGVSDFVVDEAEGLFFFAMPYIEGKNLAQVLIREGPLDVLRTVRIARQLCNALGTAHAEEVVHRDLKLENLMIIDDAEGRTELLKVLDFGIAKVLDQKSLTDVNMGAPGTPGYAAPEQVLDPKKIDARTDLFSMGVVLYGLLTGREPWKGSLITEPTSEGWSVIQASISVDPKPPETFREGIPPRLESLILNLLSKEQADRPASARHVDEALAEIEADLAAEAGQPTVRLAPPTTVRLTPPTAAVTERRTSPRGRTSAGRAVAAPPPEDGPQETWAEDAPPPRSGLVWKAAIPIGVAGAALAIFMFMRSTQLPYAQFQDYVEQGQVTGVQIEQGALTAKVEGTNAGEYRVDLSGRPLHPLLERLRSAGVPISGAGAGRVSLQAVRTGGGEAVDNVPLVLSDSTGPVCEPCAAGNLVRVGSGWYRVQAAGATWAVDSVQIVVDEGGFENEVLAGGDALFVPADAVFQVRVAVSPAGAQRWVDQGRRALEQGRALEPADASALALARRALAEEPGNAAAAALLTDVAGTFSDPVNAALARGDAQRAQAEAARCAQMIPEAAECARLARLAADAGSARAQPPPATVREPARPTRTAVEPAPRQAPAQIDPPPTAAPPPAERPRDTRPATGTLAVRGSLADGMRAVVAGPSGERAVSPGSEVELPAGAYEVRVSGLYRETVSTPVTVGAGSTASVTLATPPLAAAVTAASRNVVEGLVQRLERRSPDLLPLLPSEQRQSYRALFESRSVSNWEARLTGADEAPVIAGEEITVPFSVMVTFAQQNVRTQLPIRFRAHLEQAGGTWRARSLDILP